VFVLAYEGGSLAIGLITRVRVLLRAYKTSTSIGHKPKGLMRKVKKNKKTWGVRNIRVSPVWLRT
jgi:hypothetical protein